MKISTESGWFKRILLGTFIMILSFGFFGKGMAAEMPDLIVSDIAWSPSAPAPGSNIQFTATVKNQGTAATPSGTIVSIAFSVDGTLVNWSNNLAPVIYPGAISIQPANAGVNGTDKWTATVGTHSIAALADDANRIVESNESNNALSVSMSVGSGTSGGTDGGVGGGSGGTGIDLVIMGVGVFPSSPAPGTLVAFNATVKNQGMVATPSGTALSVAFLIDGMIVSWSDGDTASLAPGASRVETYNGGPNGSGLWTATGGGHTLVAFVDHFNRFAENNEGNNKMEVAINGGSTGGGGGEAGGNLPDLIVSNLQWSPAAPGVGAAIQFTATVKNQGAASTPTGPIITVGFLVDGTLVNWSNNLSPVIHPGAISIQTANGGANGTDRWTATAGSHTVSAIVDDQNSIAESNESNNKLDATLTIGASNTGTNLPDMIVTAVTVQPAAPVANTYIQFGVQVKNQGTAATPSGVVIGVSWAVDGTIVNWGGINMSLAPGAVTSFFAQGGVSGNGMWYATAGTHTLEAWVDDINRFPENNENNNKTPATITVAPSGGSAGTAAADRRASVVRGLWGTYDRAPYLFINGRYEVDVDTLINQLVALHVNSYEYLIWHSASDWDVLPRFLTAAAAKGISVWVHLVPPSEQPPIYTQYGYCEPYRTDYVAWAREIAKLSLQHPNLVGWAIDDFDNNLGVFTPTNLKIVMDTAHAINPNLSFTPVVYDGSSLGAAYRGLIDGLLLVQWSAGQELLDPVQQGNWMRAEVAEAKAIHGANFPVVSYQLIQHWNGSESSSAYARSLMLLARQYADGCLLYLHPLPTSIVWSGVEQTFLEFQNTHAWRQ